MKSIIIVDEKINNTERKFGSNKEYFPAFLELSSGEKIPLLFTRNQLDVAVDRARGNTEEGLQSYSSFWDGLF